MTIMKPAHLATRVLACGDRRWMDWWRVETCLDWMREQYGDLLVIEGACAGADTFAHVWAKRRGQYFERYPAKWEELGKRAGPVRNEEMIRSGRPHVGIAFHDDIKNSRGTADMVRRMERCRIPYFLVTLTSVTYHDTRRD